MDNSTMLELFRNLGIALAIGLLVGLERGWQQREVPEGQRVAGLRTLAIVGLAGGVSGLLSLQLSPVVLGMAALAMAAMLTVAHLISSRQFDAYGITGEIATFTTFLLAALATVGQPAVAAAGAVAVVVLLGLKPELHRWLALLKHSEILAALELLVITVIVLPVLPNEAMGPWQALNPFQLWLLVVLVSTISFVGHFAVRALGQTRGILLSGAVGGLASATALTVSFARLARRRPSLSNLLATGTVLAQTITFPRVLAVVWVVSQPLAEHTLMPLTAMMVASLAYGLLLYWRTETVTRKTPRKLGPPFRIKEALVFGLLLVLITLFSAAMHQYFGRAGIYLVAAIGALTNLTAATLSIAQLASQGLDNTTATYALVIAASSATLFKAALAGWLGGPRLGLLVGLAAVAAAIAGLGTLPLIGMNT
ncbi:MAG TPA: MgtC/SapB family protein [Salinisphaeraceae bacterium]|nr:MgtC/SapB family protein [Salinisphaeraceae bacterium]